MESMSTVETNRNNVQTVRRNRKLSAPGNLGTDIGRRERQP